MSTCPIPLGPKSAFMPLHTTDTYQDALVLIPESSDPSDTSKPRASIDRRLGQYSNIGKSAIVERLELSRSRGDRNFRELALGAAAPSASPQQKVGLYHLSPRVHHIFRFRGFAASYQSTLCRKSRLCPNSVRGAGIGIIEQNDPDHTRVVCRIMIGTEYSDPVSRRVHALRAYVPGVKECIGRCTFEILKGFPDCADDEYSTKRVVGILNIDSWNRHAYRGVGTLLMQASMERGIALGAEGRIALHSAGEALGFYYKLGMRSGYLDHSLDRAIDVELQQAALEQRSPHTILDDDAALMYLPQEAIAQWQRTIQERPVFRRLHRQ